MNNLIDKSKVLKDKTILVIEDDHMISRVYSKWLTLAGAHIEAASDGALGLRTVAEKKIDLILLDLGMPGLNGYDTIFELKKNPKTKDIPIIVLSNTTMNENRVGFADIRNAGIKDILRKYETSLTEMMECICSYFPEVDNKQI
jgi:CheY-like chemotaxis protein